MFSSKIKLLCYIHKNSRDKASSRDLCESIEIEISTYYSIFLLNATASDERIGTYCGTSGFDLTTGDRYMRIDFDTDGSIASYGFRIYYQAVQGQFKVTAAALMTPVNQCL